MWSMQRQLLRKLIAGTFMSLANIEVLKLLVRARKKSTSRQMSAQAFPEEVALV